ncbi:MAG: 30S ribosomal protein S8 [Clostridiales bacterium]|nr:30S ribosomal protein S8 [Clostridiales bacterium]
MQTTDAIADMLTRIRNASAAKHPTVEVPASNMKKAIASILLEEGYIKSFDLIEDGRQGAIKIVLKYGKNKVPAITGIQRVSKPGLRRYSGCREMPQVIRGLGIVIVSTSKGVITDRRAKALNVGGEVLAYVW